MADDDLEKRRKALRDNLKAVRRAKREERQRPSSNAEAVETGMRIVVELVAGVVVGGLIGWYLDRWLDTAPWLLVVFFLFGLGAGLLNIYRQLDPMADEARDEETETDRQDPR